VCDVQERFRPVINNMPLLIASASRMTRAARELSIPILVSEQYPKAFGPTVPEIAQHLPSQGKEAVAKSRFSMLVPEVEEQLRAHEQRKSVLLCGLEAHVCVFQTTRELLSRGYDVHLLCDAISSSRPEERSIALQGLANMGAHLRSVESVLFDLMEDSKHPSFKAISSIVKDRSEGPSQMGL